MKQKKFSKFSFNNDLIYKIFSEVITSTAAIHLTIL